MSNESKVYYNRFLSLLVSKIIPVTKADTIRKKVKRKPAKKGIKKAIKDFKKIKP